MNATTNFKAFYDTKLLPDLKKEFCVYSDDQVEARYILSPSLIERIVDFKQKWDTKVYLSFRDSKVYIAIKMKKNLFETRLFKSIVDYNFIEENIRFLILLTGIVRDLTALKGTIRIEDDMGLRIMDIPEDTTVNQWNDGTPITEIVILTK